MLQLAARSRVQQINTHHVVNSVITLNLAVAVCSKIDGAHEDIWAITEAACLIFFGVEMLAKMRHQRRGFWRSRWNLFDVTVIMLAALPMLVAGADLSVLRVARVARLFHLGRHVSNLRLLDLLRPLALSVKTSCAGNRS
jgi:voltage-gated sodium channel